ncbi:hypothetical protein OsI_10477 [Oryza sativa Indica Group]|uniref:Uncharacterized protein n=1 Tax=Oryza sativa subsp. indica TaxID=39946 RepID=B8AQI1_ORYSI|nr:hypothetical protein OsI_10477 [Oryza sativa Indica Group]
MVRLVDALVHGGGDDDDDDDGGGGYYYFAFGWEWEKPLLEGTLVFGKSVALQGWRLPPSGGSTMGSLRSTPGSRSWGRPPAAQSQRTSCAAWCARVLMFLTVQ